MRKGFLLVLLIVFIAAIIIPTAFAAEDATSQAKVWFEKRMAEKELWVEQAVKDGKITPEQGKAWTQHLQEMKEYHKQNGYSCPGGGMGQCQGKERGRGMGFKAGQP